LSRRLLAVVSIGLLLFGCSPSATYQWPTVAPLPNGATVLELHTEPPGPNAPPLTGCPLLNYDGSVSVQGSEVVLGRGDFVWPRGFSARLFNGQAELVAPDGTVIARAGDHLEGLGGYEDDGLYHVCSVTAAGNEWGPWGVRTLIPASPGASG
jgi:hypothetical protein